MKIRFIKLGDAGCWERDCIEDNAAIRLGYQSPHHDECLAGKWDVIREYWLQARKGNEGAASRDLNQIRDFYELSESDLWITFYQRKMYWCHAHREVQKLTDGSRIRRAIGGWSCLDRKGNLLSVENIDGRITKVQAYRGTICGVELPEYLIRKINGDDQPEIVSAQNALMVLKSNIEELIKGLWWNDFELLIDLIFSHSGWQRISVLGKTQKDIDLDIFSPVTQKRAFVQVKSTTNIAEILNYCEIFKQHSQYDEMYFVYHTLSGEINKPVVTDPRISLWDRTRIADLVVNAGLTNWLIAKRK